MAERHEEDKNIAPSEKGEDEQGGTANQGAIFNEDDMRLAAAGRVTGALVRQFNDPLQAITNVLGGIHRRGAVEPDDITLVNMAYEEVKKLNVLVRDLRTFYQPILRGTELVDIGALVVVAAEEMRSRFEGSGIELHTELPEDLPAVPAAAKELKKVFCNILENAFEACSSGEVIHVKVQGEGEEVVVAIHDEGSGMDEAVLPQLFEPFNTSKENDVARGLGLAMSYAIVVMHRGTIEIDTEMERGTAVQIRLPVNNSSRARDRDG